MMPLRGLQIYRWSRSTLTLDAMHPSCYDTIDIYHNICLAGLVQIRPSVLEKSRQRDFCNLFLPNVTLIFDLLSPKVDRFMPLTPATCANLC